MRRIGLLGGMSWESSVEYERIINSEVRRRLGGVHSADLIIRSYDFAEIEALQESGGWNSAGELLAADAVRLEEAGADIIVLCTNTMHVVAPVIEAALARAEFLHLADATARAVVSEGIDRIALLGTRYTMEMDFYRKRLERAGLDVRVPDIEGRAMINDVIYRELVQGEIRSESRDAFLSAIHRLLSDGAEGVIAGCTEIELLVEPQHVDCPYFPTTRLHALAAVEAALAD
jgi:aspartate racemase